MNCVNAGPTANQCTRSGFKTCYKEHHNLLHFEAKHVSSNTVTSPPEQKSPDNASSLSCYQSPNPESFVLLPTAVVNFACNNTHGMARVLLDSCSKLTLISDAFIRKFRLPTYSSVEEGVAGVGGVINSSFRSSLRLSSQFEQFEICIDGKVVPQSSISYKFLIYR